MFIISKKVNKRVQTNDNPEFKVRVGILRDPYSKSNVYKKKAPITFYGNTWMSIVDVEEPYMYISIEDNRLYFVGANSVEGYKLCEKTRSGVSNTRGIIVPFTDDNIVELFEQFTNRYYREIHFDDNLNLWYVIAEEGV